ncbi:MAG: PAS domain-containing protein, partial [Litorimonas sp.]
MAPDDIFAAQFWPWPDPAIKRDEQGRVLFVNGAFLALYGGTVQDWTGNVVGGWPAPQGPGQPYRFETRIPATDVMDEQVYDWMEMTLADGHAFALARNITMFMGPAATDSIPPQSPDAAIVADTVVADNVPQGGTVTAE